MRLLKVRLHWDGTGVDFMHKCADMRWGAVVVEEPVAVPIHRTEVRVPLPPTVTGKAIDLSAEVRAYQCRCIDWALHQTGHVIQQAAALLGMQRTTLTAMMRRLGMRRVVWYGGSPEGRDGRANRAARGAANLAKSTSQRFAGSST